MLESHKSDGSRLAGLEVFDRVVQLGSFSAAARALGLTPSAVSKQIGRLEDRLGVRLFARTTRHLKPTEVGRALAERAGRILADLAEAEQAVSDLRAVPRGLLRVSLPIAYGRLKIVPLIPAFLVRYPEVRIEFEFNDRMVDLVADGFDLAIRIGELADSSLIAKHLAPNRRLVCGAPSYFARHAAPKTLGDLEAHNCLVYTYRASRNDWTFTGPDGKTMTQRVSGRFESNHAEANLALVLEGFGVALLPLWLVGDHLARGELVEVLAGYHAADSAIQAIYPPGRHLSPKVRAFLDFLTERLERG